MAMQRRLRNRTSLPREGRAPALRALRRRAALGCALAALAFGPAAAAERQAVDLELVLAVDVSSSVDDEEYFLQMYGLAQAFRHPDVLAAIRNSGSGGVAVSLVQWSDSRKHAVAVDWTLVRDAASAAAFADGVLTAPRLVVGGQTSIGGAIRFAIRELETNAYEGARRTIDLSGDGRANAGAPPERARRAAVDAGIVVNGLAIRNEEPFVDNYFANSVIAGETAFLVVADDYEDFAAAMIEKLIREIGIPLAAAPPPPIAVASAVR